MRRAHCAEMGRHPLVALRALFLAFAVDGERRVCASLTRAHQPARKDFNQLVGYLCR